MRLWSAVRNVGCRYQGRHREGSNGVSDVSLAPPSKSLSLCPYPWRFVRAEVLQMNHIGVAAHRAVLNVFLIVTGRGIDGNLDLLAATGADVDALIDGTAALSLFLSHEDQVGFPIVARARG